LPLFLVWAMHLVHMPLQVPAAYLDAFRSVACVRENRVTHLLFALLARPGTCTSFIDDKERREMHAMTNFVDGMVGTVVDELKALKLWEETLVVFHADNGGEIMLAGKCGGNNWPLRGGKFSNWEGGVRVRSPLWHRQACGRRV
jgi:arylsulfatase I/J